MMYKSYQTWHSTIVFHLQILRGSPGVKPSEPLLDFIHSFHDVFKGGIFWINGRRQELVDASAAYIKQVCATNEVT